MEIVSDVEVAIGEGEVNKEEAKGNKDEYFRVIGDTEAARVKPRVLEDNMNVKVVEKAKKDIKVKVVNLSVANKDDLVAARQVTASQCVDTVLQLLQLPNAQCGHPPPDPGGQSTALWEAVCGPCHHRSAATEGQERPAASAGQDPAAGKRHHPVPP